MADTSEKRITPPEGMGAASEAPLKTKLPEGPRAFSWWEKVQILVASWLGYLAVRIIGPSLRWEIIGWENHEAARQLKKGLIFAFWHCEILPATWFWRKRGIVVMASQNFDGEYIARIIRMHGYGVARGSSSRRASRALVEMIRAVRKGSEAAFTLDGPRGPRHIAKPGVVLLAKATGAPILCFHIVPRQKWVLSKSWDRTEFPRPFTRTAIFIAPPIFVPVEADDHLQAVKLGEVQEALDGLELRGKEWKGKEKGKWQMAKVNW
ncbi:MAG TPA: lysophospholipid acyltransferase family protein [Terriglobia bacterium]|nr:lysophospholipid acyltransferase family protein [Terriglobia bacterium]